MKLATEDNERLKGLEFEINAYPCQHKKIQLYGNTRPAYRVGSYVYHMIYPDGRYEKVVVGPDILNGQQLQLAVPGGTYKAAELTSGSYGLVSESVAPGWEAEDMIDVSREELLSKFPQHKVVIERLANKK